MSEAGEPPVSATDIGDLTADAESARRQAMDWLRRLTSGEMTRAELDDFNRWRGKSPEHRRALAEANLLWDVLGKVAREAGPRTAALPLLGRPVARRALLAGASAMGAAFLLARPPLHLWPTVTELMAAHRTATGERRQLAIGTGIEVEMNTQTSLTAPVVLGQTYSLELISGQLAVSVQAEADRSVIVAAAGGQVQADRAKFDIRRDGASVCATCEDGELRVVYRSTTVTLGAGQQVTYNDRGLGSSVAADPKVVTAWQRGLLIFHNAPLAEVVEEVNRYRPGHIILLNDALARRKVVAGFRLDQVDEIVNYIGRAFGAKVRSLPGGVVLLS